MYKNFEELLKDYDVEVINAQITNLWCDSTYEQGKADYDNKMEFAYKTKILDFKFGVNNKKIEKTYGDTLFIHVGFAPQMLLHEKFAQLLKDDLLRVINEVLKTDRVEHV